MHLLKRLNLNTFSRILLPLFLCSACQFGYGLAMPDLDRQDGQITPRTKGPTLDITPRTKGSTLLNGAVIWPADIARPEVLSFEIQGLANNTKTVVQSAADGSFLLELPENTQVRLEAQAKFDPELILKAVIQVPKQAESERVEISLASTAVVAMMDYARTMGSGLEDLPMEKFHDPEIMPQMNQLEASMKPFLETNMQSTLENMPPVQEAMKMTHAELQRLSKEDPEFMD